MLSAAAWAAFGGRVKGFLKGLPLWVYIVLLAALLVWLGTAWHGRVVSKAISDAETRGATAAYAKVEKKARELEKQAAELTGKIKERQNEQARATIARADALLVRGPGRATCSVAAAPGTGNHRPAPARSPPVGRVSYPEGIELIGLPFPGAVALARNHDLCLAKLKAWEDQSSALWDAWRKQ